MAGRLAKALAARGVDTAFGVPGGGANLDAVGAMEAAGIRFVLAHGETAAAIMASVHGHVTGAPTPVIVTRGPGAASVVNGAAQATLDRHPLVVVTDTVPSGAAARVPHQRLDQRALMAPVTKHTSTFGPAMSESELDDLLDLATCVPAGAVHLDYDTQAPEPAAASILDAADPAPAAAPTGGPHEWAATVEALARRVARAERPIVIIGLGAVVWAESVRQAVERFGAPTFATYQAAGVLPTEHALAAGLFTNGVSEQPLIVDADLIVAIGLDPVEPRSAPWPYEAPVISLAEHPTEDPYAPIDTEIVGDLDLLVDAVLRPGHRRPTDEGARFRRRVRAELQRGEPAGLGPVALVQTLIETTAGVDDLTVTVDAGAHFLAIMPFWPVDRPQRLLISNGLATMGYAIPAAVGAALARPDQPVLALMGDGGLGMTLSELETVVRLDLPITSVVFNDSGLSLIEIKQGPDHGGRAAVAYRTTDFAALARTMGMQSVVARSTDEVVAAMADGPWTRPRMIDARIDPAHYRHLIRVTRG